MQETNNVIHVGRRNWNIPKHLARFVFSNLSNPPRLRVQVFPPDPAITIPFFTATFQPFRWAPSFPFSSKVSPYLGLNVTLVQPPLPASEKAGQEEICGTERWARMLPLIECKSARLTWVDVEQPDGESEEEVSVAKWCPKIKPMKVGLSMEGASLDFPVAEWF